MTESVWRRVSALVASCCAARSCSWYAMAQVPLRRVNQAYVIATSTSVDVGSVDVAKFDDAYFLKPEKKKEARAKKGEENFFQEDAEKTKARPRFITPASSMSL